MAFPGGVDNVRDALNRILAIRQIVQTQTLVLNEAQDGALTTAERDAIRTRLATVTDNLRQAVKAEVATW